MRIRLTAVLMIMAAGTAPTAGPGYTPGYDFTSLFNTDFVVLIGFLLFLAILFYFNVPSMLGGLLDGRARQIQAELAEARALREEALSILANYERKQRDVAAQSERIIAHARAEAIAEQASADLQASITRRLHAAEDRITNAEQSAVREVRDRAIEVAVAAAAQVIADQTSTADQNRLIDSAIADVEARLH
ncbi:MAG: ATP F0F1 synthase subunit B [Rhodobacteraceae bacterium]|nr:ATP F0F1 synthase subunit B [Paracoccaceae bacterium]